MHRRGTRLVAGLAGGCLAVFGAGACGSSGNNDSSSSSTAKSSGGGKEGGAITVLIGTAPDYLDPSIAYTTQAAEVHWLSYLGLLTYKHAAGQAGGPAIPARAEATSTHSQDPKKQTL